jgi:dihydropteroate synthase
VQLTAPPQGPSGLPEHLRSAGRCLVMGIVNVTPDSFSDGGRWLDPEAAVAHALELVDSGADLVDVGGESTRPGAQRVDGRTERDRVVPVVAELSGRGIAVSIDTMNADTALAAVEAGACLVNDVSGGLADPLMLAGVADTAAGFVVMHWRAQSHDLQRWAVYSDDPVGDIAAELDQRVQAAIAAGLSPDRLVVDPGLGFAKGAQHNWALLARSDRLRGLGLPVLLGASRKRFLGALLARDGVPRPVDARDAATDAITALAAAAGAWAVRVHDVRGSADAVRVVAAVRDARSGGGCDG